MRKLYAIIGVLVAPSVYSECVDPTPIWSCYNVPVNQQQNCHCVSGTEYNFSQIISGANSIVDSGASNTNTRNQVQNDNSSVGSSSAGADDKYGWQHLSTSQVNSFLITIKKQTTIENGLLEFIDYKSRFKGKSYYGSLNCLNASNHKIQSMQLTKKFAKQNYNLIFNKSLLNIINTQAESNIFANDQGLMFGNGDIWFNVNDQNKIVITAINSNITCPNK